MATVSKHGKGYRITVSCGFDANKKRKYLRKLWMPPEGLTEKQLQKELERVKYEFEAQCRNGDISAAGNPKLSDFCGSYMDIQKDVLQPRTYEFYSGLIEKLIIPKLGHLKVADIRPAQIQGFIKDLSNTPKPDGSRQSASSVRRKLACLQSIFRQAVKLQIIKDNPANAKYLSLPHSVKQETEVFTKQEIACILSCLTDEPLDLKCIVHLALASGAREGEIVGLKFSDVNFEECKITFRRSAYKVKGAPISVKPPKDNDVRTVAVYPEVIEYLRRLQMQRNREREQLGTAWQGADWIFTTETGSIMHPQTPSKRFRKFLARHGLKHRKFHALRHTSATLLLFESVNIRTVQERLGHGSLKTTQLYLHCIQEADTQAANALRSAIIQQHSPSDAQEIDDFRRAE